MDLGTVPKNSTLRRLFRLHPSAFILHPVARFRRGCDESPGHARR